MFSEDVQRLIEEGLATQDTIQGVPEKDIQKLEDHIDSKLPNTFRQFLRTMGMQAGRLFRGSDFEFPKLFYLTDNARSALDSIENGYRLPGDAFVCYAHQGYIFNFFLLSEGENPPVYSSSLMEEDGYPMKATSSFTEFIRKSIEGHVRVERRIREARGESDTTDNE